MWGKSVSRRQSTSGCRALISFGMWLTSSPDGGRRPASSSLHIIDTDLAHHRSRDTSRSGQYFPRCSPDTRRLDTRNPQRLLVDSTASSRISHQEMKSHTAPMDLPRAKERENYSTVFSTSHSSSRPARARASSIPRWFSTRQPMLSGTRRRPSSRCSVPMG